MFKSGSFEAELAKSMADNLAANKESKKQEIVKSAQLVKSTQIERAVNHLNEAAALFDKAGFAATAEILTRVLEKLAKKDDEPEFIEFESLLHGSDEPKSDSDLDEQIIEILPLSDKKKD